jgi:hypothetical protein
MSLPQGYRSTFSPDKLDSRTDKREPTALLEPAAQQATSSNGAGAGVVDGTPVVRFVTVSEYVASAKGSPEALLGDADAGEIALPAGGLMMFYGDAGVAKTTLALDMVAHLASGTDWLGFTVARPVKVALIENEGPAEQWRQKLLRKVETWKGEPWADNVLVVDEPHGGFDFRDKDHCESVRELRRQGVELVVADPTKWLGFEGGGTPSEVADFVALLRSCGLHSSDPESALAFALAHHENKSRGISGAWCADPDTVVHVEQDERERTKLTWEKCRWATSLHGRLMLLGWLTESASYEEIELPDGPAMSDEEIREQIRAYLAEHPKATQTSVREAVNVRSNRVDAGLESLKEAGECLDLDRNGRPHAGQPRTPRLWILTSQAESQSSLPTGTTLDDSRPGNPEPGGSRPVVPPIGGTTTGRDNLAEDSADGLSDFGAMSYEDVARAHARGGES